MKLSDIKGERSIDVIADILDPIYEIAADEKCAALFKRQPLPEGMTTGQYGAEWLKQAAQVLLKGHKKACIKILATIEGTSVKKYTENLNLMKLLTDVADLMSDEAFMGLFFSTTQSTETSSGSASENTEATEA